MRSTFLPPTLLLLAATTTTNAFLLPDFQPFLSALPITLQDYLPFSLIDTNATYQDDLRKRQQTSNACPTLFKSCANLGAPQLCCASGAVCSADFAGHVACCPSGAACSGTISGVITAGTVASDGSLIGGAAATTGGLASASTTTPFQTAATTTGTSTGGNGLVIATTGSTVGTTAGTTGGGFILAGSSTVATPGSGVRRAEVPVVVKVMLRALEYLPI
ncbi:hypothetical protein BAUCODRAFT_20973 [Baudoinia panamericana UAMH 10762]|uniref:Uncharacterized protein n=1 Tax=Baudoinia panamericana (strain UAMH 10762) TaxID=717646 RepID=M2NP44_BAUPA|nr:uncharacterized protein BAUCODRAFT_20973 [Baudoinia panamericana UAMH 10762]EMD01001.1 hypothetical protein BAUCODRAFT_20973 [Baudoinia panamericana UAMH 10762]